MEAILALLPQSWVAIITLIVVVLEIVVRLIPSLKNNSIIKMILDLFDNLIPNLSKEGGQFIAKTDKDSSTKPRIIQKIKPSKNV